MTWAGLVTSAAAPCRAPRAAPGTVAGLAEPRSPAQLLSGILPCLAWVLAGGEKQRNWSSSSAAPHPALSWACSETSPGTRAGRRTPALQRDGYGGAGGSSDLAWESGLALAARIPSTQPCPLGILQGGCMEQRKGLCNLDLQFPICKAPAFSAMGNAMAKRSVQPSADAILHSSPTLES